MKFAIPLIVLMLLSSSGYSQITKATEEEPAHIYFTRVSRYATHAMFYIFDGDSLINVNEGLNWFRYDCEAGDHLLWITNRKYTDFVEAEVEAGKSYLIMIDVNVGYGKSSTRLRPLSIDDKDYNKALALICDQDASQTPEDFLLYKSKNLKKKNLIKKYKEIFYSERKKDRNYRYLDYSFEVPSEAF